MLEYIVFCKIITNISCQQSSTNKYFHVVTIPLWGESTDDGRFTHKKGHNWGKSFSILWGSSWMQLCLLSGGDDSSPDDVIKFKHFPRHWPFVRWIHRSPVNSLHKGQWRGAFMFSLICAWINLWVNNREAGDLRRYRAHYDVIVMISHHYRLDSTVIDAAGMCHT